MVDLSPRFGLTFLAEGGGGAELYVNENAVIMESMTHLAFADRDATAPPGSPTQGATYLVAASATGAWDGQDGNVAIYTGTRWVFVVPDEGMRARVRDENVDIAYDGASWVEQGTVAATKWLQVRVATTANVNLSTGLENGDTIDGVTLATGDLVLVRAQSTASQNGIYTVPASGAASRASVADTGAEVRSAVILVSEGTTYANQLFLNTNTSAITLGSTSVTYALVSQSFLDTTISVTKLLIEDGLGDGRLLYSSGDSVQLTGAPPGSNYVPYWDGAAFGWDAYTP